MTDIDTIKQLYTPTSTAETQAVISSVSEQEKKQKKETAAFGEILKNVSSLATKIGKDVKSFKLAKEGGFGEGKTFKDFFRWQSTPDYEREPFMEKGLSARLKSDGTPYTVNDLAADADTSLGPNIADGKSGGLKSSLTTGVDTSTGVSSDKDYEPKFTLGDLKIDNGMGGILQKKEQTIEPKMVSNVRKSETKIADKKEKLKLKQKDNGVDISRIDTAGTSTLTKNIIAGGARILQHAGVKNFDNFYEIKKDQYRDDYEFYSSDTFFEGQDLKPGTSKVYLKLSDEALRRQFDEEMEFAKEKDMSTDPDAVPYDGPRNFEDYSKIEENRYHLYYMPTEAISHLNKGDKLETYSIFNTLYDIRKIEAAKK